MTKQISLNMSIFPEVLEDNTLPTDPLHPTALDPPPPRVVYSYFDRNSLRTHHVSFQKISEKNKVNLKN